MGESAGTGEPAGSIGAGEGFPGDGLPGAGGTVDAGSPFPGEEGYGGAGGALSSEEQVAILDGELDSSIAVFDGMILDERSTIQGMEDANPEQGLPDGGGIDEPLFEEGDLAEEGAGQATAPPAPGGGVTQGGSDALPEGGEAQSGRGAAVETARADGGIPSDLIDGSDDDIVARQIREAAIKETDPVLKEKLWEEYRKYKNKGRN